jgi:hypothetical protein
MSNDDTMAQEEMDAHFAANPEQAPNNQPPPKKPFDIGTELVEYVRKYARRGGGGMSAQYAWASLKNAHQDQARTLRKFRDEIQSLNRRVRTLSCRLHNVFEAQKLPKWRIWLVKFITGGLIDLKLDRRLDERYNDERE